MRRMDLHQRFRRMRPRPTPLPTIPPTAWSKTQGTKRKGLSAILTTMPIIANPGSGPSAPPHWMYGNPNRISLMPSSIALPLPTSPLTPTSSPPLPRDQACSSLRQPSKGKPHPPFHLNRSMRYITGPINPEYRQDLAQITCQRDNLSDGSFSDD
jgi:hypothetical protein